MDNQLPTSGVGGSGKSGMVVVVLAVLAALALGAFYVLWPKTADEAPVTEGEPRVDGEIVPLGEADMREGIGEEGIMEEAAVPREALVVSIASFKFVPATISIKAGESVTWKNNEAGVPHSIVLDNGDYKSAVIFSGEEEARRFPVAGTFSYYCGIHPTMKGVVVVK